MITDQERFVTAAQALHAMETKNTNPGLHTPVTLSLGMKIAQASVTALTNLLLSKKIISRKQIDKALADELEGVVKRG